LYVHLPLLVHLDLHPLGKRVHHRSAHPVQTAGDGVYLARELGPGVKKGHNDLKTGKTQFRMGIYGDPSTVVLHRDLVGLEYGNGYVLAYPGHSLVYRVVDDLYNQMVQTSHTQVADVHGRTTPDSLQSFQDLNL
jgi:hypothetical protein